MILRLATDETFCLLTDKQYRRELPTVTIIQHLEQLVAWLETAGEECVASRVDPADIRLHPFPLSVS